MSDQAPPPNPQPAPAPAPAPAPGNLASHGSRLLARILDGVIAGISFFIGAFISGAMMGSMDPESPAAIGAVLIMFIPLLAQYILQFVFLAQKGQSIGKMALNIKIVMVESKRNGGFFPNVILRTIVNGLLGFVPFYGIVDILLIFREDRRCIHDLIAGTEVVNA